MLGYSKLKLEAIRAESDAAYRVGLSQAMERLALDVSVRAAALRPIPGGWRHSDCRCSTVIATVV